MILSIIKSLKNYWRTKDYDHNGFVIDRFGVHWQVMVKHP